MDDLISRKDLLEAYDKAHQGPPGGARKLIEEAPKSTRWISVNERLPEGKTSPVTKDFEEVLCATTFGDVRAYKFGKPIGWQEPHFWHDAGLMDEYVTHWMPLPEMPREESANERVR